ncbi:MAG: amidase family protein [Acidobacteria bacterium]|nr:amidase family protein [Acidobacteriota bacterium]
MSQHAVRAGAVPAALLGLAIGCAAPPDAAPTDYDVAEKSVRELAAAMADGTVTAVELVAAYLDRIEAYDQRGPALNAMIAVNPRAAEVAAERDAERAAGNVRGPLHGIPVVVKDNYDTADMPTTAGTLGLATSVPPDDSTQVRRLREAGAIVLGKTNMHELARGITTVASFGGQTRNPYDPTRNPGGSSGGTGAAVGASFGAFGMGSDTCGSIRIPSAHHALVGLRGTRGLASGDGIVPLSTTQDFGGPLARTVRDLAYALDATVGFDPADETTRLSEGNVPATYTAALNARGLAGARLGLVAAMLEEGDAGRPVRDVLARAAEDMERLGATVVEIDDLDPSELTRDASVIGQEFPFQLDAYLEATPGAHVRSLADFVSAGLYHGILEGGLARSLEVEELDTEDYRASLAKRDEIRAAVTALLDEQELDALMYPTIRRTARPIGQPQPGSNCALSATSGLPAITVPGGFAEDDMPVGVELLGRAWAEPRLIELAFAYEQGTGHRRAPDFTPSLVSLPAPVPLVAGVQADPGLRVDASFVLSPATRTVRYQIRGTEAIADQVLLVALHRRGPDEDAENGPVLRYLSRRSVSAAGSLDLTGPEMHALREGRLYVAVHTTANLAGAVRIDLALPE